MSNARFSITQSLAVSDPRVSNAQFRTLAALGTFGDKEGWCFPKLATLSDMLGKSRQAISKDLQALQELGYIEIRKQWRDDGSRRANLYRIKFDIETDTCQRDDDTPQPQELTPLNPRSLHPSTPEVDAITPHSNAPVNAPVEDIGRQDLEQQRPNIFTIYEQEVGALSPLVADELIEIEKEYPDGWFEKAVREARRSSTRVSLKYIEAILKRWKADGLPTEYKGKLDEPPAKRNKFSVQFPFGAKSEVIA